MIDKRRKKAVALAYDEEKQKAPKVTAVGRGITAENIIKKASESEVPIYEDPSLAELLSTIQVNTEIPEKLYEGVAEVFAFIYEVDKKYKKEHI